MHPQVHAFASGLTSSSGVLCLPLLCLASPVTIFEADFYHADQLLPQSDEALVARVKNYISQCLPEVAAAQVRGRRSRRGMV